MAKYNIETGTAPPGYKTSRLYYEIKIGDTIL
jgi:hypothetical protein